jgi:hypothetical protein
MDCTRHLAGSELKRRLCFPLSYQKMDQYNIEPRHTYNTDEEDFSVVITTR